MVDSLGLPPHILCEKMLWSKDQLCPCHVDKLV
jgi:hypothetical protein